MVHLHGDAQRRIADNQRGVGVLEHFGGVRPRIHKFRLDPPVLGGKDSHQRDGTAGARVERDVLCQFNRLVRDDKNTSHRSLCRHRHSRQHHEILDPFVLDGGNDSHVGSAAAQRFSALRWKREGEIVSPRLRPFGETPHQRRGIQVFDN